ncbi:MAG: hypothetical protein WAU86_01720 [Oricola sp.]
MQRYFLNMETGEGRYFDDVGCMAADECEILSALIEVLSEYRGTPMYPENRFSVSIIDNSGNTVVSLTM